MINEWNRPVVWLIGGIVLLGLFGAFVLLRPDEAIEPADVTIEVIEQERPTAAPAPVDRTDMMEETAVPAAEPTTADNSVTILTGDDRSSQLHSLTSTWNTNWARRTIDTSAIMSGGPPRDGIPSIDAPQFVSSNEAASWLVDNEPVIALEINGDARAYPLQVLTWHEIVNDAVGGVPVVVTFCPLCNSALVFDRRHGDEVLEFGVSGLLRNSDLIMYDRTTESLWQQFTGEGIIGDLAGEQLAFVPSALVSFADFRTAYPDGDVLSRETGFSRDYGRNPYEGYDTVGSNPFLYKGPVDGRLQAVERVVTVSLPEAGLDLAYPLSTLSDAGVINDTQGGRNLVVFHKPGTSSALGAASIAEGQDVGATGVFDAVLDDRKLTFRAEGEAIVDEETGSTWNILGQALAGPLAGQQLEPVVHGDHFWFSWAAFKPGTIVYEP
jgi:hypothetical protein